MFGFVPWWSAEAVANGLLVRDFFKQYREVRYANQGSIRLEENEHSAYALRLTLEITHYDAGRAINYKTLPENTHWGYLTSFHGTAVKDNVAVKFAKQRVYQGINQGIWEYHQNIEVFELLSRLSVQVAQVVVEKLRDSSVPVPGFERVLDLVEKIENGDLLFTEHTIGILDAKENTEFPVSEIYKAYPIASPFPDLWKFKSDIPASFVFRLESWYLVNPVVYVVDSPVDSGDETDGEDEYPEPEQGDGNGDSQEFPESSPVDPRNDPRDGGAVPEPELDPTVGYTWDATVAGVLLSGSGTPESFSHVVQFQSLAGSAPFTIATNPDTIITVGGESWKNGYQIYDRFGQSVGQYFRGVGFRTGSLTVSARAVL